MRTNIEIDDALMREAMETGGFTTKRETVAEALRIMIQRKRQHQALLALRGIGWEGDLDEMRRDKPHLRGDW